MIRSEQILKKIFLCLTTSHIYFSGFNSCGIGVVEFFCLEAG